MQRSQMYSTALMLALACERPSPQTELEHGGGLAEVEAQGPATAAATEAPIELSGTHVVVRSPSRFYASADASEPIATRSYLDDPEVAGTLASDHVGWVMRLGRVTDTRAEVTLLPGADPDANCGWGMERIDNFELSMWVDRSSLLPVTAAITQLSYADGTSVKLPAGIPILPADDEHGARISAWGFELPLADNTPATAHAFVPAELPAFDGGDSFPKAALALAGAPLELGVFMSPDFTPGVRVRSDADAQAGFVDIRGRCVEVAARVDLTGAGWAGAGSFGTIGGGGYGGGPAPVLFAVEAGAIVRWPDGSPAGHVREAARLVPGVAPGQGRCGYFAAGSGSRDVVLCFAEADARTLPLGHVDVDGERMRPSPSDAQRVSVRVRSLAHALRVPCVSHAVEADAQLDVSMKVHVGFGPRGEPPTVTLRASSGKPSEALQACVREQVGTWTGAEFVDAQLDFELRVASRPRARERVGR